MLAFLVSSALGQTPSEEIIVYGDDFARWNKTRWWLQEELVLPGGLLLAAEDNAAIKTHALQVRAIVLCDKDAQLSGKKWEVSCVVEDVGLLVTTTDNWQPQRQEIAQAVLDQIDARLSGSKIQLQVERDGAVTNFDVEGLVSDNLRERRIQETFRTLTNLVMAGFHLEIPDHAQRDGQWVERHTELMDIPSLTAARGSTEVIHQANAWKDDRIVQTVGRGTVAVAVPHVGTDPFNHSWLLEKREDITVTMSGVGDLSGTAPSIRASPPPDRVPTEAALSTDPRAGEQRETTLEATWAMELRGVAVFEKETGIMTERVWICSGTPMPGSASGSATGGPYLNVGRLYRLGPDETPVVGPTKQVAWPGNAMEGLDPWAPLDEAG